jgi:hypothetical protein
VSDVIEKTWNTEDIRKFKQAFGTRNKRSESSPEPPHDPGKAYADARKMLDKRRKDTTGSFEAMLDNKEGFGPNNLVVQLQKRGQDLSDQTDERLKVDEPEDFDKATEQLTLLTDEWVKFEARCISAYNEMTAGKDDAGVRQKLADRAARLPTLLEALKKAAKVEDLTKAARESEPSIDFRQLEIDVGNLTQEAGKKGDMIVDTLDFGDRIEVCKAQLQALTNAVADKSENRSDLYRAEIKQLYGLDVTVTPTTKPIIFGLKYTSVSKKSLEDAFPYKKFLDTLAMVPSDHSMNKELLKVVYEKLEGGGGDYSESEKRIRIDPEMRDDAFDGSYKDPETGQVTPVDAFAITTLHEIGHAVDAAYGIMKSHQGKPGCGGWEEQHPIVYMLPQHHDFCNDMIHSGVADEAFQQHIDDVELRTLVASVAVGNKKPSDAQADLEKFWQSVYDKTLGKVVQDQVNEIINQVGQLMIEIFTALPQDRKPGDFKNAQAAFAQQGDVANVLSQLTGLKPPVFTRNEFWQLFKLMVEKPQASGSDAGVWMSAKVDACKQRAEKEKQNKIKPWVSATVKCLPKTTVDLKDYLAGASPWKRDVSLEKIGEEPASHESYKGSAPWWRYSSADRTNTFVTNYQWRAPGEWFAELYAITWFKKVEPPTGVAKEVRQYMFGGHITPNQAV